MNMFRSYVPPLRAEPGPHRLSSRAEGEARSRGICRVLQADFSAPSGRFSCPPLVPVGSETASTAHASAIFPYQVDFLPDHLAHFSCSFASGGHENRPTAHDLTAFSGAEGLKHSPPRTPPPAATKMPLKRTEAIQNQGMTPGLERTPASL